MKLEEAIKIAKEYFKDKELPRTTREWRHNCPPELTAGKINMYNFTVGQVLSAVNPKARKPRTTTKVEYSLESLGFSNLEWVRSKGHFTCAKCGACREAERSSILNWLKAGKKYCSFCRKEVGSVKDLEYYNEFLPEGYKALDIISQAGNTKLRIQHIECKTSKVYSSRHILNTDRKYLVCPTCDELSGFSSKQEKLLVEHLISTYPSLNIKTQVKYSSLFETTRRWTLDVLIEELNLALEITTKGNGFEHYFENLEEKLQQLRENTHLKVYVVYSIKEVDDIVRSLLKDKEGV